jgi:hypothetical protein
MPVPLFYHANEGFHDSESNHSGGSLFGLLVLPIQDLLILQVAFGEVPTNAHKSTKTLYFLPFEHEPHYKRLRAALSYSFIYVTRLKVF